ncbi:MAG: hypothetical protein QHC90_25755 [Shinella sp.]|nr:hypothetical protein [Shinella sp.]
MKEIVIPPERSAFERRFTVAMGYVLIVSIAAMTAMAVVIA